MNFYPAPQLLPALVLALSSAVFLTGCNEDKKPTPSATESTARPTAVMKSDSTAGAVMNSPSTPAVSAMPTTEPPAPPAPPVPLPPTAIPSTPAPQPTTVGSLAAPGTEQPMRAVDAWEEIKDYTYAQKSELVTRVEAMIADMDSGISALRGGSAKPDMADTRSAGLAALDSSRAILIQKRDALQYASADTWQSAKTEFRSAWRSFGGDMDKVKAASN